MAQVKRQPLQPGKKKRSRKRIGRNSATGEFTVVRFGTSLEINLPVPESTFLKIGKRKQGRIVRGLLADYVSAAQKATSAGRTVKYTVRVAPEGDATFVGEPDALDAALDAARQRGRAKAADILKGEDMLTAGDFGSLIGASHETVNVRRRRGEILGLQAATRVVRYPNWQVTDAGLPLPGLAQIFEKLGREPWAVYRFLRTTHAELGGRTALEALKDGEKDAVLHVAHNQTSGAFT